MLTYCRELEQDLVPEWRVKYFDYKVSFVRRSTSLPNGLNVIAARKEEDHGCGKSTAHGEPDSKIRWS
jgi:hypothetical protein